jgi:CheY-like chemotaxis protein
MRRDELSEHAHSERGQRLHDQVRLLGAADGGLDPPPLRVLIVDDDSELRELVTLALLDEGYEVVSASDGACLSIVDHGVGTPAGDLGRVFDRYYRAPNVVGRFPGEGIGLSGSLHIVQQHGGTIEVQSTEGQGSTFTVRLPLWQVPSAFRDPQEMGRQMGRPAAGAALSFDLWRREPQVRAIRPVTPGAALRNAHFDDIGDLGLDVTTPAVTSATRSIEARQLWQMETANELTSDTASNISAVTSQQMEARWPTA